MCIRDIAGDELGVVPELLVEQTRNASHGLRVAVAVGVLEIVALLAVGLAHLDDVAFGDLARDVELSLIHI